MLLFLPTDLRTLIHEQINKVGSFSITTTKYLTSPNANYAFRSNDPAVTLECQTTCFVADSSYSTHNSYSHTVGTYENMQNLSLLILLASIQAVQAAQSSSWILEVIRASYKV